MIGGPRPIAVPPLGGIDVQATARTYTTEETGAGSRSGRPGDSGRRRVDQVRRRRLVATEEAALPVLEAIDLVVVRELRGAADEDAVANLFLIVVLHPPVARLAERNFVPLAR